MDIGPLPASGGIRELEMTSLPHPGDSSFATLLRSAVNEVNQLQQMADDAARDFASGKATSIHDTMIALEKADLSFRLLTQVRNKAVEAYQEIMRMPI